MRADIQRKEKTVLVFGTFDGLHEGHRFLLKQARELGTYLIASVAQDSVVREIKKRPPVHSLEERMQALKASKLVDKVVGGDTELGNWSAVTEWKPDIVAIGYDQSRLEETLREHIKNEGLPITLVLIPAHKPRTYHSSLLH